MRIIKFYKIILKQDQTISQPFVYFERLRIAKRLGDVILAKRRDS